MSEVCLPGLQGFPVQVSGWTSLTEKSQLIMPNDIHLQFSPSETPMKYFPENGGDLNFSGANSFFISGNQYNVYSVRLTKPSQEGLQSFSGTTVAEFQIWGYQQSINNQIAVLIIPVYTKPIETYSGAALVRAVIGDPSRLIDCIPGPNRLPLNSMEPAARWPATPAPGQQPMEPAARWPATPAPGQQPMEPAARWPATPAPGQQPMEPAARWPATPSTTSSEQIPEIVRYKTCVETDSKTTPMIFIDVAYWSTGTAVKQTDFGRIIPNLAPSGVPFKSGLKLLTSFTQLSDENFTKADRKYEVVSNGATTIPYKKSVSLSANSKDFQNAFRIIKDFTKEKEDSEPKFIPINLETDIKDGLLLIDLKTGKKLSAEDVEANLKKPEIEIQPPNINTGIVIFLKIVGVILGLIFLIILISIFQRFINSSKVSSSVNSFESIVPSST